MEKENKGYTVRLDPEIDKAVEKIVKDNKRSKNFVINDLLEKQLKSDNLL